MYIVLTDETNRIAPNVMLLSPEFLEEVLAFISTAGDSPSSTVTQIEHIKRWCTQSQSGLSNRGVADAVIRMCDDALISAKQNPAEKTARELELEDLLVSARAIAERNGEDVAWERFSKRLKNAGIGSVTANTFRVLPSD